MASVVLHDVAKRYGDNPPVITGINLEIQEHEFMVLVGPSGCGKSTLLRMVAGLEEITSGTIEIGGRVVNDVPPKDRDIAMVFQSYALYPHMNVRENLEFGLKIRGTPAAEIDRMVNDAAKILGLEGLLERRPKDLSGGQRQRVALGRAIVREPSVFLFDEPLSNLDAKLRVQMRAEIKKLQHRLQVTSIYVTHDQVEAMTMGNRIALLDKGKLQQVGTPLDVYETPQNVFVANFIGTPPMNFIRATVTEGGAGLAALALAALASVPVDAAEIVVWHAYRAGEKSALEKVAAAYNSSHPSTKVSTLAVPYDAFADKISAAVPRGKGPDVFIYAQDRLGGWSEAGNTVEPIDFFLDPETKARFIPTTMEAMTYKGTVYGLPLNYKCITLIYNKKLVSAPPKDSNELVAIAKKLTDKGAGRFGLAYAYSDYYYHAALQNAFGGYVFEGGAKPAINHPANAKAHEYL